MISQPASATDLICSKVASTSRVSVFVIDCTVTIVLKGKKQPSEQGLAAVRQLLENELKSNLPEIKDVIFELEFAALEEDIRIQIDEPNEDENTCKILLNRDIAPEGDTLRETNKRLDHIVALAGQLQKDTGVKLLWGTSNCFSHERFTHGAGTNPDAHVFAWAAAQIKKAMECTLELKGQNYVFWGGREGYSSLLNTNMAHEQDQMARLLHLAVDHKKEIGFKGTLLVEPKPKEPTKHQYDYDAATVLSFLRKYDLLDEFKLNIEANHATLAGHTFEHDLQVASADGKLGSIDANRGDYLLGWDTDQFPTDLYSATYAMLVILKQGGIGPGGINFDAKVRRGSFDPVDLFHAHIGGMDSFARGLKSAQKIIDDGAIDGFIKERYASYRRGIGKKIMSGKATFAELERYVHQNGEPEKMSGREEKLENIINSYI